MKASMRAGLRVFAKLLVSLAGVLLLLEVSARVFLFGLSGLVPSRINSVHALLQTGFIRASEIPGLGFELRPGLDRHFKLVPFRTNSRGLRDREYALEKPEGTFRVAVLGSSFALPAGVAIEDAFHSLLEERLSRRLAPRRIEFINFAVAMYDPAMVLGMLEGRALAYDPDLVLFTTTVLSGPLMLEDPDSEAARAARREALREGALPRPGRTWPILQSYLVRLVAARTGARSEEEPITVGTLERIFIDLMARISPPEDHAGNAPPALLERQSESGENREGGSILERLSRLSERSGIPIVVVRLEYDAAERRSVDREVAARARSLGLFHVDTREAFRGTRPADFWIYELDPHPNARAHARFAEVIGRFLDDNDLLPSSTRTSTAR